jgi:hypothetical protein
MDQRDDFSNAHVSCWAAHQVAGTGRPASPHMTHRFKTFKKALPSLGPLQSTAVTEPIAHRHMTAFDGFGRLAVQPMKTRPQVLRAGTGRRYSLDVRLVVVGHDLVRDQPAALDGLAKERLGTGRIAVITEQHVHHHTVLVDTAVINAIARVTGGNSRLVQRLFAQIHRIVTINQLPAVTTEVVSLARENWSTDPFRNTSATTRLQVFPWHPVDNSQEPATYL